MKPSGINAETLDPVWIDTDPGLGLPFVDVDDAIAIHALWAANVTIAGMSSCFGNAGLARVHPVAEALGDRMGIAVHRGAREPRDTSTPAVEALCAHTGVVLALAPLTNIAAALRRGARWSRLIVLGGTYARGPNVRRVRTTELNLAADLDAAALVLDQEPDLVPMEPCRRVWFRRAHVDAMPAWLADGCRGWLRVAPIHSRRHAFCPWDLIAAMWLVDPDCFSTEPGRFHLRSDPFHRGHVLRGAGSGRIVTDVDPEALIRTWTRLVRQPDSTGVPP